MCKIGKVQLYVNCIGLCMKHSALCADIKNRYAYNAITNIKHACLVKIIRSSTFHACKLLE